MAPLMGVAVAPGQVSLPLMSHTESPVEDFPADTVSDGLTNASILTPANFVAPAQPVPDLAFGARIAEKDPAEPAAEDSFVSGGSSSPANAASEKPHYGEEAIPANFVEQRGSEPQPDSEHKEESFRPGKISSSPEPRPEEPVALKPITPMDPASRPATTGEPLGASTPMPARTESQAPAPESHAAQAVEVPPAEQRPAQPVRDVTVRLTLDTQLVDVKLFDRGGELQVAVHSADPTLTTDLRASVHDLVDGLEKSGFHTETWQPADMPRHTSDPVPGALRPAADQPQWQTGEDPRRQGRSLYDPSYAGARRTRISNREWIEQLSALTSAEREN
jgi:hypothetical protein